MGDNTEDVVADYYKKNISELEKQGLPMEKIVERLDEMVNMENIIQYHILKGGWNSFLA